MNIRGSEATTTVPMIREQADRPAGRRRSGPAWTGRYATVPEHERLGP